MTVTTTSAASPNIRRPLSADELEPMRRLGERVSALRVQAGLSHRVLAATAVLTPRQLQRIESAGRRTRRSTLDRLLGAMLLAYPDLGDRGELLAELVALAGHALAPESLYAEKSAGRREGKLQRASRRVTPAYMALARGQDDDPRDWSATA